MVSMEQLFVFSNIELIAGGILFLLFLILFLYYVVVYARPLRQAKVIRARGYTEQPPVTVIVYAKNESENLRKNLPALLTQDYPDYQVVVINDGSTDESDDVLNLFEQDYKHLYHTYIPEDVKYISRKKLALTVGIKAAKHDILLFTEANCEPISKYWIASMARNYSKGKSIVLGYSSYEPYKGFMHKLISFDTLINGLQHISSALAHRAYAGNGRNLSYLKSLFFDHKGYRKSLSLHAGDDDLFINESANKNNTEVEYSSHSIVRMGKIDRFKVWKEMKVSRAATQRFYKGGRLSFFRFEDLVFLLFIITSLASIYLGVIGNPLLAVFAGLSLVLRLVTRTIVLHKSAKLLQQRPVSGWIFILELILPLFNIYVHIYRMFRGKNDFTFRV